MLDRKVAIVIGAAGRDNIGQAIARRFSELGASVVVSGRDEGELSRFAGELQALAVRCDITEAAQLAALGDAALSRYGRIDIAVNAVGLNLVRPFADVTRGELDAIIAAQFIGPFLFLQAMVKAMTRGGSIIQISSVTSRALLHDHAAYMATKAAGDALVRSVAYDYGRQGIRVNCLSPGPTLDAPMAAPLVQDEAAAGEIRDMIPLGRIGTGRDVADAAAWLASDFCFVTGENIQVNGGLALHALREIRPGSGGSAK